MSHHIIYIPGLGDRYDNLRRSGIKRWNRQGLTAELVPMQWNKGGTFSDRKQKIETAIDTALAAGHRVALIGESAGASMAINIMTGRDDVMLLVTLCGVASPSSPVAPYLRRRSPTFDESLKRLSSSHDQLHLSDVVTFSAFRDSVVRRRYSTINGANNRRLPSIGHFTTITLALTVFKSRIIKQIVEHGEK